MLFHLPALVTVSTVGAPTDATRSVVDRRLGRSPSHNRVWKSAHLQMAALGSVGLVPASRGQIVAPFALGIVSPSGRGHDIDGE